MAYIWENYSTQKKFRLMKKISPYIEAIERNDFETEVNPLLRFTPIFDALFDLDEALDRDRLANTLLHFLARLDRCSGVNELLSELSFLDGEIDDGFMGVDAQTTWRELDRRTKFIVLCHLRAQLLDGGRDNYFFAATSMVFPSAALYLEKSSGRHYIFVAERRTAERERLAALLEKFFWSLDQELEWVWRYHFGIIDHAPTMVIDQIQIM